MVKYPEDLEQFLASLPPGTAVTVPDELLTPSFKKELSAPSPVDRIFDLMRTNASNRDLVIETAECMSQLLAGILSHVNNPTVQDRLKRMGQRHVDFKTRIQLALVAQVIPLKLSVELEKFREIRNSFGHDPALRKFEHDQRVIDLVNSLEFVNVLDLPTGTLRDKYAVAAIESTIPLTRPPELYGG